MRIALYYIIFGAVFGFMLALLFKGCGKPKTVTVSTIVTVHDTIQGAPTVDAVLGGRIPDKVDTVKVIHQYFDTIAYTTAGHTRYGIITVHDTVSQGQLIGQSIIPMLNIPVTQTVKELPRNQLFIGINAIGSQKSFIEGFGPSAMFKLKSGKTIEAGAYLRPGGGIMYEIGLKTLIKLK